VGGLRQVVRWFADTSSLLPLYGDWKRKEKPGVGKGMVWLEGSRN